MAEHKTKYCKKYAAEGIKQLNKMRKQERIKAGKKIKSKRMKKTWLMKWDDLIRNTKQTKPYFDAQRGVMWGFDRDPVENDKKMKKAVRKKNSKQEAKQAG